MTLVDERLAEARLEALERKLERAEQMVIERDNAGASEGVRWFWRGRVAGLQDALALLREDEDRIHPRSPSGWEDGLEPWRDGNEDGSNRDVPPFDNDPRTDEEIKQAVYDRAAS